MDKKVLIQVIFAFILTFLSFSVTAQDYLIRGSVRDAKKNQSISYCSITVLNSLLGTHTDEKGNFELSLPAALSNSKLIFSYIGYQPDTIQLDPSISAYTILLYATQNTLDEITITGLSKASEEKENPATIKMVTRKAMEQSTESNIIDILTKNVPGLNAVKTGPNVSKPYIRGLGYNRVLTLYDGVPQEGQQFEDEEVLAVDMYNMESAEIILGPGSLQYGTEALAGAINLVPATPKDSDKIIHGRFFSEYQSNNGLIGNGVRFNYGNKHWSFVIRGAYRIAKNYTNSIDGKVYNTGFREINASGATVYKSKHGYSSLNYSIYDNSQGIPDGSRDSLTRKFTKAIFDDPEDDLLTRPVVSDAELNSYALTPIYQRIRHFRVYNKNQYEFRNGNSLYAMISFQQNQRLEHDFPNQKKLLGVSMRLNSYNYDFNYLLKKISNTNLSFGMNGVYQTNKNIDAHDIPIPDYHLFDIGTYALAKWKYKKWTVIAGIRYDARFIKGNDFYTREDSVTELLSRVFLPDTTGAELLFPSFKKIYIGVSSNLGVSCQVNEQIILKANLGQGFRPPHVSEFASNGLDGSAHSYFIGKDDLKPEYNWQVDLGANFNYKDISASFTVFSNYVKNYIYMVQLVDDNGNPIELIEGNKTFQYQQNNAELVGLESTIDVHPSILKGFSFVSNFSMIYGFNLNKKYKKNGVDGEYLPSISPIKLLSAINQDIKLKSKVLPLITCRAEADFNAAQRRYLSLNRTETETPAYVLLNASINFPFNYSKRSSLQLQFQANNLLNKAFQSHLSRLKYLEYYSGSPNGHLGIYGMGRNLSVKLILPF